MQEELKIRVGADISSFQTAMNKLGAIAATAAVAIAGAWTLTKIIGETKQLIVESTLLASRYTSLGVVMTNVGRNVGVGADQMEKYSQELMKTGISAIESRQNLIRMGQANIDLSQSTKLARIAQDSAVIGMMNSSEAFGRMIHGIQAGQTEVLRTIGINVNFQNSYRKLAEQLGKTTKELTEQEKAQARVNAVIESGKNITGTYEAAMSTASKQMYSMQRYTEDLKVEFGKAFEPAFTVLIQATTEAIKDMSEAVKDPKFQEELKDIALGFIELTRGIMDLAVPAFKAIWPILTTTGNIILEVVETLVKVGSAFKLSAGIISEWAETAYNAITKLKLPAAELAETLDAGFGSEDQIKGIAKKKIKATKEQIQAVKELKAEEASEYMALMAYNDAEKVRLDAKAKAAYAARLTEEKAEQARVASAKKKQEALEKLEKDMAASKEKQYRIDMDRLKKEGEALEDFYEVTAGQELKIKEMTAEQIKEIDIEKLNAEMEVLKRVTDSMKRTDQGYFEFKRKILDNELSQLRIKYKDNADILAAIDASYLEKYRENEIEKLKASGNLFDGIKAYLEESKKDITTWGDVGYNIMKTFAEESRRALSNIFFDFFTGELKSLSDYWDAIWKSMLRVFTDALAQMVFEWAKSGLVQLLTGGGLGGFSVSNLLGGTALGNVLGIGGGVAAGGLGSVGVGATATVAGGAAFEAFSVGGTAAATTTTGTVAGTGALSGSGALLGVGAGILAAPVLGPTMTSAFKNLMQSFGLGGQEWPTADQYIQAALAGLDYVPGFEGKTQGWLSGWMSRGIAEKNLLNLAERATGMDYDPSNDPYGSQIPAFIRPDLYEQYKKAIQTMYEGYQYGGIIDKVFQFPSMPVPQGDDGYVPAQVGEMILSKDDIKTILSSKMEEKEMHIHLHVDGYEFGTVIAKQGRTHPEVISMLQSYFK